MAYGEKSCPYCGQIIREEAIKCRFCGEFLEDRPRMDRAGYPPRGDRLLPEPANATTIFVLGLLGILVCGILGVIAYFMGRTYKEQVAHGLVRRNGLADAGYILGLISVIMFVVAIIAIVVALIIPLALGAV